MFARYGTSAANAAKSCRGRGAKSLPTLPVIPTGEIVHMCRQEKVRRLSDILLRRTTIAMEGRLDIGVIEEVARIAAAELGWSAMRLSSELEHTRQELKRRSLDVSQSRRAAA